MRMRIIFVILFIFLISPIWANSQNVDFKKVKINSNEGYSLFLISEEKCPYCLNNGFKKDYLILEQTRSCESQDEFATRLYIFVGVYYLELYLDKKECQNINDSIRCSNYFILTDRIMEFLTNNHFPDPIVRNMYLVRDNKIEIFRATTDDGILIYNMVKSHYLEKY
jgi:hypothetical protein